MPGKQSINVINGAELRFLLPKETYSDLATTADSAEPDWVPAAPTLTTSCTGLHNQPDERKHIGTLNAMHNAKDVQLHSGENECRTTSRSAGDVEKACKGA